MKIPYGMKVTISYVLSAAMFYPALMFMCAAVDAIAPRN